MMFKRFDYQRSEPDEAAKRLFRNSHTLSIGMHRGDKIGCSFISFELSGHLDPEDCGEELAEIASQLARAFQSLPKIRAQAEEEDDEGDVWEVGT